MPEDPDTSFIGSPGKCMKRANALAAQRNGGDPAYARTLRDCLAVSGAGSCQNSGKSILLGPVPPSLEETGRKRVSNVLTEVDCERRVSHGDAGSSCLPGAFPACRAGAAGRSCIQPCCGRCAPGRCAGSSAFDGGAGPPADDGPAGHQGTAAWRGEGRELG